MVSLLSTTTFSFAWDGSPLFQLQRFTVLKAAAMLLHGSAPIDAVDQLAPEVK